MPDIDAAAAPVVMRAVWPSGKIVEYRRIAGGLFRSLWAQDRSGDVPVTVARALSHLAGVARPGSGHPGADEPWSRALATGPAVVIDGVVHTPSFGPGWVPIRAVVPHLAIHDEAGAGTGRGQVFRADRMADGLAEIARVQTDAFNDARVFGYQQRPWCGDAGIIGIPRGLVIARFSPHSLSDLPFLRDAIAAEMALAYTLSHLSRTDHSRVALCRGLKAVLPHMTTADGGLNRVAIARAVALADRLGDGHDLADTGPGLDTDEDAPRAAALAMADIPAAPSPCGFG